MWTNGVGVGPAGIGVPIGVSELTGFVVGVYEETDRRVVVAKGVFSISTLEQAANMKNKRIPERYKWLFSIISRLYQWGVAWNISLC
jgi:hypothetical protein